MTENCVPACLACNGSKGDQDVWEWYRGQEFYDPLRATALKAWMEGDLKLAVRVLEWRRGGTHQTRQASGPLWRWQMAS